MIETGQGFVSFDGGINIRPEYGMIAFADTNPTAALFIDIDGESVNVSEFIKSARESLGQSPVIIKCSYCGQWGAKYCACRYCGAPVG